MLLLVCNRNRREAAGEGCTEAGPNRLIRVTDRTNVRWRPCIPFTPGGALVTVTTQLTVDSLPVLVRDGIRLREVELSDAAALTALFQLPEVSKHLDPPPATVADFSSWIELSRSRRVEGRAACYTVVTEDDEAAGLFMALRFEDPERAEIGFAMSPRLWGTGAFQKAAGVYLDFLFSQWCVTTLVGKTQVSNARAMGAMRKLGAVVLEETERNGHPEYVWTIER
jgi:RimJ/RimL family protein N-acetyltransferase